MAELFSIVFLNYRFATYSLLNRSLSMVSRGATGITRGEGSVKIEEKGAV